MSAKRLWIYLGFLGLVAAIWAVFQFLFPARKEVEKQPPLFGTIEEHHLRSLVLEKKR